MKKKLDRIVRAATPDGQRAGEAVVEIIENQLRNNDSPETREALERYIRSLKALPKLPDDLEMEI